jgi:hypothetical protein
MIRSFVDKNCLNIYARPRVYLISLILISAILFWFYLTLPIETSVESLVIENDPDLVYYQEFKEQFGEDEFLVVGFEAPDVFDPDILEYIRKQTQRLQQIPEIEDVVSLSNAEIFRGFDNDFIVEPLFSASSPVPEYSEQLRQRALASTLIAGHLVNRTSSATLFLLRPADHSPESDFEEHLVSRIEAVFADADPPLNGFRAYIAGWLVTDVNMSRFMLRDMSVFMPLTFGMLIILVGAALRNFWASVLALVNVSVCLVWTMAFLNLLGGAISPITSILPPLIMALAVADSIHIFNLFLKQERGNEPLPEVMRKVVHHLALPCFLTSFTTAIGFASLCVSQVPPIRYFGLAAAGGMMAEFFLSMTLIPLGLYFMRDFRGLRRSSTAKTRILYRPLKGLALFLPRHCAAVVGISAVLFLGSLLYVFNIRVETNLLEYFKSDSDVRESSRFIDTHLGGFETLEISLAGQGEGSLLEPRALRILEKIEQFLMQQEIVTQVTSVNDFFREMNKAFHNEDPAKAVLPHSRALAAQYLLLYDGDDLEYVLNEERDRARISARIIEHNSHVVAGTIETLQRYLDELTSETAYEARITGKTLIANKLIDFIVSSQAQSLTLALVLIFLLMLRIFRSLKLGVISLVPNILPVLFNFAVMGLFDIPLNTATAIIAAVAIGIAVDDTIHFICNYQHLRQTGADAVNAVEQSILDKGHPIITTSLIMTGAFAILLFGSFVPTIQFGLLCSLIMLFAIVADLVVLPAIFLILEPQPLQGDSR